MKFIVVILIFILTGLVPFWVSSQNNTNNHRLTIEIPEVALIGIIQNGEKNVQLSSYSPTEAGTAVKFTPEIQTSSVWINYSSTVKKGNHKRKIVAMVEGEIPAGIKVAVEASEAEGTGKGKPGHPVGSIILSNEPAEIITDIGSCYTGKGARNGHFLSYRLIFDNPSDNLEKISQMTAGIHVIYTLTDYN